MHAHKHVMVIGVISLPDIQQFQASLLASPALSSVNRVTSPLPAHPPQRLRGAAWSPHVSITLATSRFLYLTDHIPGPSYFISFQNILNYLFQH